MKTLIIVEPDFLKLHMKILFFIFSKISNFIKKIEKND